MSKKYLAILGSTGSIGRQALEVVDANPNRYAVFSLGANKNIGLLKEQIKKYHPQIVAVGDREASVELRQSLVDTPAKIISGYMGIREAVASEMVDIVLVAISGIAGLLPTIEAIEAGKRIALANKETMVAAGSIVNKLASKKNVSIIPVDSEHSAIFQCLHGKKSEISKLILTASGGPFRCSSGNDLQNVTPDMALAHPNWSMGKRISVDSATMMNKGLEIIEAKWFFDIPYQQIDVLVHPQSIIHSMVEYIDGSIIANLGVPSMKIPIQYALSWPERISADNHLCFSRANTLTFEEPNTTLFPCLDIARKAGAAGGIMPTVLNGADEVAVELFLERKIPFLAIPELVQRTLDAFTNMPVLDVETIIEVDRQARNIAVSLATNL